ncbi:hypothetical protein BJY01DRAFT_249415 [Aspergillus pseudoustus]|uniref:Hydantoinase/oxoprolinase-domain-containing protein n=1 Tax=Aspergillus pseudoustus TaxID=1810923 RepID=A0ABR4JNY6_9EURO
MAISNPSSRPTPVRIGVDVGGTNTDAVVLDPTQHGTPTRGVLASHKTPTTPDATAGVEAAIRAVLQESGITSSSSSSNSGARGSTTTGYTISSVTIGTTAFLNAVIERDPQHLTRVAVLRLSKSFLRDVRPFSDWPLDLARAIEGYVGYADGGLHIDGSEEAPVVEEQIVRECREIRSRGLNTVVIAGVYSPIDRDFHQEDRVRDIVAREIPGADIVCSHEVANIGFLERENASILNAAILRFARRTIRGFQAAMGKLDLTNCPLYLTQNDGTLLDAASAARVPIRTFSSGVTNSMRGAAYLSGLGTPKSDPAWGVKVSQTAGGQSAIVVDIGGTTTDVGVMLPSGLPRQASAYVSVAGIKVNYSLPHLHSIGLGGGSIIQETETGDVAVGPASVGHELTRSLAFGGDVRTATDVAVAAGLASVGGEKGGIQTCKALDEKFVKSVLSCVKTMLEHAIDTVKTSPDPMPVFMTGGGSVLAPDTLQGASEIIRPPFHDVANAVGAACSKVGATVDIIQNTSQQSILEATEVASQMAVDRAVSSGAVRETVYIAKVDAMPIPYLDNQIRTVVTAIGELDISAHSGDQALTSDDAGLDESPLHQQQQHISEQLSAQTTPTTPPKPNPSTYRPTVVTNPTTNISEWHISTTDLEYIADGCYLLGCGGGGNPEPGKLQLRDMLAAGYTCRVIDARSLNPADRIYWGGRMGSPAAISERLQAHETVLAMRALEAHLAGQAKQQHEANTVDGQTGFGPDAVMALEIGGSNGMEPFLWGSTRFFDVPIVDGDFMGRANPMCWQTTLTVHRPGEFVPCAIDDGAGRTMLMTAAPRDEDVDGPLRGALAAMGSLVGLAPRPTTGEAASRFGVLRSVSLAWRVGRAMARAEAGRRSARAADAIVKELGGEGSARVLFRGKVAAVDRTLRNGLSVGVLRIVASSVQGDEGDDGEVPALATDGELRIPFINENILAEQVAPDGTTSVLATVPDLIALIDRDTGRAVGVPEYRYGCHVVVLGIACSPRWTETPRGIEVGGPKGYGYDLEYKPLGKYTEPRSVIDEFL